MKSFAVATRKILLFFFLILMLPTLSWGAQREFNLTIDEVTIDVAPGFSNKVFAFNEIGRAHV